MEDNYKKASEIVKKYHQEHLLDFYDELDDDEKEQLCNQIINIDFEQIFNLYEISKINEDIPISAIDPLHYYIKDKFTEKELTYYSTIGENSIKNHEFAVVTMAGGQR